MPDEPSESSPLLKKQSRGERDRTARPHDGRATSGNVVSGSRTTQGRLEDVEAEGPNDNGSVAQFPALEPTTSNVSQAVQFTGDPTLCSRMKYIFPAVSLGVFLSAADQTIIVSSYSRIGSDLSALNLTSFIATSYFLTLTSFQPLYGKLSDIFGRRSCLLSAYAIFGLGSLFCGVAQNIYALIAARVFQGIGGGGMTTVVGILLSDIVPLKDRGVWQGIINIVYAVGAASGAPLGGVLADFVGWRWAFMIQAPICLVCFVAVLVVLKEPTREGRSVSPGSGNESRESADDSTLENGNNGVHEQDRCEGSEGAVTGSGIIATRGDEDEAGARPRTDVGRVTDGHESKSESEEVRPSWKSQLRRVDFLGAFVLVFAVTGLIVGLDRGSNVSWTNPLSYGSLVTSLVFFCLFFIVETRVAAEPFAPSRIIFDFGSNSGGSRGGMFAAYLANFFSFGAWLSVLYYLPLFYQAVDGVGATGSALRLIPAIVASVCGSLSSGLVIRYTGKYHTLTFVCYGILTLGILIVVLFTGAGADVHLGFKIKKDWRIMTIGTVMGAFGTGTGVTTSLIALIANAGPKDQAVATACSYLFRSLGSVIGISLTATVIQQVLRRDLHDKLGGSHPGSEAARIEEGVRRSLDYLKTLDPETQMLVRDSYAVAVRHGLALMIVSAAGAFVSSWFIKEKRITR